MNRINQKLQEGKKILSIYFSAGYPNLNDTVQIIEDLEKNGVDMIEIGLPFSDPLADGPTIQASSTQALHNGMTTQMLFDQLKDIRKTVSIPLIIMGYFNPMLQYGVENFCKKCQEIGIDGLIIPDLPVDVYADQYKATFEKYGLINVFLITPSYARGLFQTHCRDESKKPSSYRLRNQQCRNFQPSYSICTRCDYR